MPASLSMTRARVSAAPLHGCLLRQDGQCDLVGDPSLLFPWWSVTKTAIAICALRLAEAGALELDVALPGEGFTLHQLLTHRAGLPDYGGLPAYHAAVRGDEEPWPRDVLVETALAQGRPFAPGQGWRYSNVGYLLARERIETAAGQGLGDLVQAHIAGPLGLRSVVLAETREEFARTAWPAARRYHPAWVYHGCLIGTASDAARMMQGLFAGGLAVARKPRTDVRDAAAGRRVAGAAVERARLRDGADERRGRRGRARHRAFGGWAVLRQRGLPFPRPAAPGHGGHLHRWS